jgi:hypothetical protein
MKTLKNYVECYGESELETKMSKKIKPWGNPDGLVGEI